jgi:hypothetical protein
MISVLRLNLCFMSARTAVRNGDWIGALARDFRRNAVRQVCYLKLVLVLN